MTEELELVERAVDGCEESFAQIVNTHQSAIRAYIAGYVRDQATVDDLAQETFIAAYRSLPSYTPDSPLRAWLLGIARHRALEHLRAEARRCRRELTALEETLAAWRIEDAESDAFALQKIDDELRALQQCMKKLGVENARLIEERYFKNRPIADIAGELGRQVGAVRMIFLRLRKSLRRCVEDTLRQEGVQGET